MAMAKKQGGEDKEDGHAPGRAVAIAMWVAGIGGMVLAFGQLLNAHVRR
jgi:hypothetical protein